MNQIPAKIYYLIITGEVLVITPEMKGLMNNTTKEEDMNIYEQLKNKNIDDVDFIELDYGTLSNIFINSKSYRINLETKQLEINYYTKDELDTIQQNNRKQQEILSRINIISQYSNLDKTSITDLENYILQREKNRIIGGVK